MPISPPLKVNNNIDLYNAPINVKPDPPPPGQRWGFVRLLIKFYAPQVGIL